MRNIPVITVIVVIVVLAPSVLADIHVEIQRRIDPYYIHVLMQPAQHSTREIWIASGKAASFTETSTVIIDLGSQQLVFINLGDKSYVKTSVHTAIPGFTSMAQMELDLSVMENLKLTAEERADLKPLADQTGLFCPQCEQCRDQCGRRADIPAFMHGYMYSYGYGRLSTAKEVLKHIDLSKIACDSCPSCTVHCPQGFDVKEKILDIARIAHIPEKFCIESV